MKRGKLPVHHLFNVEVVFVHEGVPLVDVQGFGVEDGRISGIDYVFDEVGGAIDLCMVCEASIS